MEDNVIKTNLDFLIKECNRLEFENKLLKADYEASEAENVKLKSCLQEIKENVEADICSNCITQKREINCNCLANVILDLITKAESEIKNDTKEPKTYNGYLQDEMQNKYYKGR